MDPVVQKLSRQVGSRLRVFLYEFATGGGLRQLDHQSNIPTESLFREGRAMITALAADFASLPDVEVTALRDSRLTSWDLPQCALHDVRDPHEERQWIVRLASQSDWTVVIAPEFDGLLSDRCQLVVNSGGRLLGPGPQLVRWASDKRETCRRWQRVGVAVPRSYVLHQNESPPDEFRFPAVLKPNDGAGSVAVQRICHATDLPAASWPNDPMRLEEFCPGVPCSMGIIGGVSQQVFLPPCRQTLSDDGRFSYRGGQLLDEPALCQRAERLASGAAEILEGLIGYVGMDFILGPHADGSTDTLIEINPRLTTSYIGLRHAVRENLAQVMLDLAHGNDCQTTRQPFHVTFAADGDVDMPTPEAPGR